MDGPILKYLHINLSDKRYEVNEYKDFLGPVDLGVYLHSNVYESYKYDVFNEKNVVVIGRGPFSSGSIFGSHRLTFIFRSPETKGLHISSLGGAAYRFSKTGLDGIIIEGRDSRPVFVIIEEKENHINVKFDYSERDIFEIYEGYKNKRGTKGLASYLIDRYSSFLKQYEGRIILVGPASFKTLMGGICSPSIDYMNMEIRVEDWASRGGGGSVLAKAHNVVAVIFGGDVKVTNLTERFEYINSFSTFLLGKPFYRVVTENTSKYKYNLETKTGGTFGGDIVSYRDKLPVLNWNSTLYKREIREKIYKIIEEKFLKPFNEKIISTGIWKTCDEPCPVTCKKTIDSQHIDFEPMNAMGPMLGIFNFNDTLENVELVDELGIDAIEAGNILGWLMESLERGLLNPEDLELEEKPVIDFDNWNDKYSMINKIISAKLLKALVFSKNNIFRLIAEKGLREACKKLDEMFSERVNKKGIRFEDLAVYIPFGSNGYITPNFYWTPGVFAPLPVLGRYWTYYTPSFSDPEEFANVTLNRALMEYLVDNSGWCRFHRSWVEKILPELYKNLYNFDGDLLVHAKKYYNKIREYQVKAGVENVFWESNKVLNIVGHAACEFGSNDWCKKINENLNEGLKEWWDRFYSQINKILGD